MRIIKDINRVVASALALGLCAAATASCGIEKQSAPGLTGPSEFGTSITLTVTPDIVDRDGVSQATVLATVRDPQGQPLPGISMQLGISPANGGELSQSRVTSGSDGRAAVVFTAPPVNNPVSSVVITATPIGNNFDNAATRSVALALVGPPAAVPAFTATPAAPLRYELTTLDASATLLNGQTCPDTVCQYVWRIGNEATLSGSVVTYRFQQQQVYVVTLEVTTPGGITTSTQRSINVGAATLPTAVFSVSPTSPLEGQNVNFNASGSTAPNGATIVEYTWNFGNGAAEVSGATATASYNQDGTYVVRLTVRDSNGLVATATQNVTVREP